MSCRGILHIYRQWLLRVCWQTFAISQSKNTRTYFVRLVTNSGSYTWVLLCITCRCCLHRIPVNLNQYYCKIYKVDYTIAPSHNARMKTYQSSDYFCFFSYFLPVLVVEHFLAFAACWLAVNHLKKLFPWLKKVTAQRLINRFEISMEENFLVCFDYQKTQLHAGKCSLHFPRLLTCYRRNYKGSNIPLYYNWASFL